MQILALKLLCNTGERAQQKTGSGGVSSLNLLYWYKSANTGAEGAAQTQEKERNRKLVAAAAEEAEAARQAFGHERFKVRLLVHEALSS